MRPATLAAVAEAARGGASFAHCLREFLDEFRAGPTQAALDREPDLPVDPGAERTWPLARG